MKAGYFQDGRRVGATYNTAAYDKIELWCGFERYGVAVLLESRTVESQAPGLHLTTHMVDAASDESASADTDTNPT